jgi:hypothetical protein
VFNATFNIIPVISWRSCNWWLKREKPSIVDEHSKNCLPKERTWVHSPFFGGVCDAHLFRFLCCPIMCLYILCYVFDVHYDFCIQALFGSSLPPVVCRRYHALFICVCLRIVVSSTYCVMYFVLFFFVWYLVYPMLPVFLCCPLLIAYYSVMFIAYNYLKLLF